MADLKAAITAFDRVVVRADHAIRKGLVEHANVRLDVDGLAAATGELRTALGDALPDHVRTGLDAAASPSTSMPIANVVGLRTSLGRLGAAARAVDELGGPSTVIAAGGLDAIDGAVQAYRNGLLHDVQGQALRIVSSVAEYGGGPFTSLSKERRTQHAGAIVTALQMANETGTAGGQTLGTGGYGALLDFRTDYAAYSGSEYRRQLGSLRTQVDALLRKEAAPAVEEAHSRLALISTRAIDRGLDATTPIVPELTTLTDDAQVLTAAPTALTRHAAVLQRIADRITDRSHAIGSVGTDFTGAFERMSGDLQRIRQVIGGAPDEVLAHADGLAEGIRRFDANVAYWTGINSSSKQRENVAGAVAHARELAAAIEAMSAAPQRLTAASTAADETLDLLRRPGALDVRSIRSVMGDGSRSAVLATVAEHAPALKPFDPAAARPRTVEEAVAVLDEADLLAEAFHARATTRHPAESAVRADELTALSQAVSQRAQAALATDARIPERTVENLHEALAELARQGRYHWPIYTDDELGAAAGGVLGSVRALRSELAYARDRRLVDGGLRTLSPSSRPKQASVARTEWIMRELDALPGAGRAADTRSAIDADARRLVLVSELLDALGPGPLDELGQRAAVRARTELDRLAPSWQYPDDATVGVGRVRSMLDTAIHAQELGHEIVAPNNRGKNSAARMLDGIAQDLRAWSMFDDGTLPSSNADRLAVASRRAGRLLDPIPKTSQESEITAALKRASAELDSLDGVLGSDLPSAERRALGATLDSALAELGTEFQGVWSGSKDPAKRAAFQQRVPDMLQRITEAKRSYVAAIDAVHARAGAGAETVVW